MRFSRLFLPTMKESPGEAELVSHRLMLRAGMMRKLASGIYSLLPLGLRVMQKVEGIIREEMNAIGAQELLLPGVLPAELWKETGRWDLYGKELLRFKDRHDREFCLGPTHEEVITDLVRGEVRSYRQLPVVLYQIQTKFRDEARPRFGLMRCREFSMKDAYSFDADEEAARLSYERMRKAYLGIFHRVGLEVKAVEADTGAIGGSLSHEFMVPAEVGEDAIALCLGCDFAANIEMVSCLAPGPSRPGERARELTRVFTPGVKSVQEVSAFFNVRAQDLVKTIIFSTEKGFVAALVRGDHEVNPGKLRRLLGCQEISLIDNASPEATQLPPLGFVGPVGLELNVVADLATAGLVNFVTGANQPDYHYINVNHDRDFQVTTYGDIRMATPSDGCPNCGRGLSFQRGIEVGHCFYLGTKYSSSMKATFLDDHGKERELVMGCYGIGLGRTVAAIIEQNNDADGIIFPFSVAPYHVLVLPVNPEKPEVMDCAIKVYQGLTQREIGVLLDDRNERAGVKFKDADLLGIPLRITVGERNLSQGVVELRPRATGQVRLVSADQALDQAIAWVMNESEANKEK